MLRRYSWEKAKEKLQHYRRRTPEASVLYQIVHHSRDDLQFQWESRFQHQYGCLRDEGMKTFDEYLNCGILAHGAARVYCDGCKHSLLIALSCKRRGVCPSCGAKRAVKFAEHIYSEVIEDVPHRHTVFTIPKRLRVFFKYDRKLNTILFRAAWGALSQVLGMDDRELAAIFTVQTAGEALNYHPHLHGLLADGFWKDGVFTRFSELALKPIEKAFAERVLAQLHKQELISDDDVAQILSQDHTGFGVWLGDPFHDKESEQFVARYKESTCVEDTRAPPSLQPSFLTKQYTHKLHQYNQYIRLKKHSVNCCVTIRSEDREIIASSTRSNERRQAPGPSVHFRDETYTNGDLRNEGQKTQAERLKLQTEN